MAMGGGWDGEAGRRGRRLSSGGVRGGAGVGGTEPASPAPLGGHSPERADGVFVRQREHLRCLPCRRSERPPRGFFRRVFGQLRAQIEYVPHFCPGSRVSPVQPKYPIPDELSQSWYSNVQSVPSVKVPQLDTGVALLGGRFVVRRCLGRGAMGYVYAVEDRERQREVALKTLRLRSPEAAYALKQEFRALSDITHENLVRLHELFVDGEDAFFTMELIDGVPFDQASVRALPELLPQLVAALQTLHDSGKLHRDVKPANVLVERSGRLVVLDFGLVLDRSRAPDPREAAAGHLIGTPRYMAPEVLGWGVASEASDWFSVGVMLFETLTGQLLDEGAVSRLSRRGPPPPPSSRGSDICADFDEMCQALLESDPDERATGDDVLRLLGLQSMSTRSLHLSSSHLVGRGRQLKALEAAYARHRQSHLPLAVTVSGPSGMGKTVLLRHFVDTLTANGAGAPLVFWGQCHEQEAISHKAFDELVDAIGLHWLELPAEAVFELVRPEEATHLLRLFPSLARVPCLAPLAGDEALADPRALRKQAYEALRSVLMRMSHARQLIIAVDDLQWGDLDSARLFYELFAGPEPPDCFLLLSYRSNEVESSVCLQTLLSGARCLADVIEVEQLSVAELNDVEARELARTLLSRPPSSHDPVPARASHPVDVRGAGWEPPSSSSLPDMTHSGTLRSADGPSRPVARASAIPEIVVPAPAPANTRAASEADARGGGQALRGDAGGERHALRGDAGGGGQALRGDAGGERQALRGDVQGAAGVGAGGAHDVVVGPAGIDAAGGEQASAPDAVRGRQARASEVAAEPSEGEALPSPPTTSAPDASDGVSAHDVSETTEERIAALCREAKGNPLLIHELAELPLELGQELSARGAVGLADIVRVRLSRVGTLGRQLFELLCVAGVPVRQTLLRAALGGKEIDPASIKLEAERLIRTRTSRGADAIEVVHDGIRSTALGLMEQARLRTVHEDLARAHADLAEPDVEALARHYAGAKLKAESAYWAQKAAEKAKAALAFDHAAQLYRAALDLADAGSATALFLKTQLAHALADAGRGKESAPLFLELAESATPEQALDYRRLAAEQWLVTGHIDAGLEVLNRVFHELGMSLPRGNASAGLALLGNRTRINWRGPEFDATKAEAADPQALLRVDACRAAWILSFVSTLLGAALQARFLRLALEVGEPSRVAMGFGIEALQGSIEGKPAKRHELQQRARALSEEIATPHALGFQALVDGNCAYLAGEWRACSDASEPAEHILTRRCRGSTWELNTLRFFWGMSLYYQGRFRELRRRSSAWLVDASDRGDLCAASAFRFNLARGWYLVNDDPERAAAEIEVGLSEWSFPELGVHRFVAGVSQVQVDLYREDVEAAQQTVQQLASRFRTSSMRRVQLGRIQMSYHLAFVALACAAQLDGRARRAELRSAKRHERALENEKTEWGNAVACYVRAQRSLMSGETALGQEQLLNAIELADGCHMHALSAAASYRLGTQLGPEQGASFSERALSFARGQGVRSPDRLLRALAPGV